uniref:WAP domain-containing protein n=1 Tax=Trichuris muris TaxID=70415 RepID=A0A5S6Q155_TRIMR
MGWCCPSSPRYGAAVLGHCPTCGGLSALPAHGCPDGSPPNGYCLNGHCPFNYNCIHGVCCKVRRYVQISSRGCPKVYGPIYSQYDRCQTDQDCRYGKICCKTNSGRRCIYPLNLLL